MVLALPLRVELLVVLGGLRSRPLLVVIVVGSGCSVMCMQDWVCECKDSSLEDDF